MPAACAFSTIVRSVSGAQPSARRALPAVVHHVRPHRRVGVLPVEVRRRDEELEALRVRRRGTDALVHVAAADPLRARGDADLVAPSRRRRSTSRSCGCRGRCRRTAPGGSARTSRLRVDRVPPVVVVVGRDAVPAAVVRLERVVRPAHAGVLVRDHDPLARVAERPDLRVRGPSRRPARLRPASRPRPGAVWIHLEPSFDSIALTSGRAARASTSDRSPWHDHVRRPERLVRDIPRLEQRPDRRLSPRGVPSECPVDVPAASVLISNRVRRAQVGLVLRWMTNEASFPWPCRAGLARRSSRAATGSGPTDQERDTDDRDGERGGDSDSAGHEPSLRDQESKPRQPAAKLLIKVENLSRDSRWNGVPVEKRFEMKPGKRLSIGRMKNNHIAL